MKGQSLKYAAAGPIVTSHALERWAERVVPGASEAQCETQILNMLEDGQVLTELPEWVIGSLWKGHRSIASSAWPGVILQVHERDHREVVVTVLVAP